MRQTEPPRVVWILGSGFSKSLGGPLLYDLFSERGKEWTELFFTATEDSLAPVYELFQEWFSASKSAHKKGNIWNDAEDYLEFLALAAKTTTGRASHNQRLIQKLATKYDLSVDALYKRAQRAIAAECLFTVGTDIRLERWEPYIEWSKALCERDAIITFNWDLVLESLATDDESKIKPAGFVLPVGYEQSEPPTAVCPILKMHGSVDWFDGVQPLRLSSSAATYSDRAMDHLTKRQRVPIIGMPGPEKFEFTKSRLKPIWDKAKEVLALADVVVFLGYRFPPSDPNALRTVLKVLREDNRRPLVRVYTVLGPRTGDEHTVRMEKLLDRTFRSAGRKKSGESDAYRSPLFEIRSEPLFVEDFLTVMPNV
jgi:hypothetical protein